MNKTAVATLVTGLVALSQASASPLIFSEYVEGSSNNKALEITNISDQSVDLEALNAQIEIYNNGNATPNNEQDLSGILEPGASLVLTANQADEAFKPKGSLPLNLLFNGDDALTLMINGDVIDSIGQIGFDPGSAWSSNGVATKDRTLRRINNAGNTNPQGEYDPSVYFESFAKDTADGLGCDGLKACDDSSTPPTGPEFGQCGDDATFISQVQGNGSASPLAGQTVVIEAIVTGSFNQDNQLGGYFVQEEDADHDLDLNTSEALFVFDNQNAVQVGQKVRIKADVKEHFDLTELTAVSDLALCDSGNSVTAVTLAMPLADDVDLETLENMQLNFSAPLTVTGNYFFGRYGQMILSSQRLFQPTQRYLPGSSKAQAAAKENGRNRILLDDASSQQNPEDYIFLPGLTAENMPRSGDQLSSFQGILFYAFGSYQLQSTGSIMLQPAEARPDAPAKPKKGNLRIASLNVLNYFNGDGNGGGFPTARGAHTPEDLQRQQAKLISAIQGLKADVIGLMEIENDGFGADSAIQQLVGALNSAAADGENWQFAKPDADQVGSDAIAVGLIYRSDRVELTSIPQLLTSYPFDAATSKHRQPLIATFQQLESKNTAQLRKKIAGLNSTMAKKADNSFVVAVNHFKSKGSSCENITLPDGSNDVTDPNGQGNCNGMRSLAAETLSEWVNQQYAGKSAILLGDFNAYAMEDPIQKMAENGFDSLFSTDNYSFIFDGQSGELDHLLVNETLAGRVKTADIWHINADEAPTLDYNYRFKPESKLNDWYRDNAFRSSDHDPAYVDIKGGGPLHWIWAALLAGLIVRRRFDRK
ncbi:ExeM/NucH family extracellular endonuclease [Pelagibaculum spongiae]|nr:ExeM/NucH family extracellular endonuclease [Pelagibaculum spongiae]